MPDENTTLTPESPEPGNTQGADGTLQQDAPLTPAPMPETPVSTPTFTPGPMPVLIHEADGRHTPQSLEGLAAVDVGDTVLYHLSQIEADNVNRVFMRHTIVGLGLPQGGGHEAGQSLPMIVTKVNDDGTLNGQVLLDGNCSIWAINAAEGDGEGCWE